jgi:hypothetical protein
MNEDSADFPIRVGIFGRGNDVDSMQRKKVILQPGIVWQFPGVAALAKDDRFELQA